MRGSRLALVLALIGACIPSDVPPPLPCLRLQARGEKLTYSTGPPPHYGWSISGSILLKDAPQAKAITERSVPRRLVGADGKADFLAGRARVRISDGVLHFEGLVAESSLWGIPGVSLEDLDVRIEFDDPMNGGWSASGTIEILKAEQPRHPDLERALKD